MIKHAETEKGVMRSFTSTRNACKLCSPLGASLVFRGIENCIPLIHGSQGCSTYIRRYIISHFREPIDIASSNFTESSAVFGGGANFKSALDNIIRQYVPDMVGIATTCLSETIGEDVRQYIAEYRADNRSLPVALIHASTPSYAGTHMDGYHEAVRAVVDAIAQGGTLDRRVNLIPGFVSAEDLRHLHEILRDYRVSYTMLPDYSETLDGGSWEEYQKLPKGGTALSAIRKMGCAAGTILFGRCVPDSINAAVLIERNFRVPAFTLGLPIGIRATDRFFDALQAITGWRMPEKYMQERARVVDAYIDGHKYLFGKRAVIYGEEDFVAGIASLLDEIGMKIAVCASGGKSGKLQSLIREVAPGSPDAIVADDADFASIRALCEKNRPDIIIGSSKGMYLAKKLNRPLVRAGFPVHDRIGGQRILHVGYRGTLHLFDSITNALIETKQNSSPIGYSYI